MPTVNDAGNVRENVERERDKLRAASIPDRDREAIQRFVTHRRTHGSKSGSYSSTTERDDMNRLRLSSERADTALVDMGIDDLNRLLDTLTTPKPDGGYGITTGIDAYTRVLRVFFGWLDDHNEYGGYGWWEQVKTGNVDFPEPSKRDFPTQEDIDAIKKAAGQHGTMRDVALISFFADTAVRRSLGAQLRVGDIDLDSDPAMFEPNPNGEAQKGVEVKPYPMFDCVAELRTWLNNYHPDPENPEAPLWTNPEYVEYDDPSEAAIGTRHINRLFNKFAERAGVEDVEHKPHAYRHAAVGRWKERGYSLGQVQRRTAWKDQAAAEMWGKYGDPRDEAMDTMIADLEGQPVPDDPDGNSEDAKPPERRTCHNCKLEGVTSDHCPQCGAAVSAEAQAKQMDLQDALTVLVQHADTPEKRAALADLFEVAQENPGSTSQSSPR